jgi:hypothetical protein
VIRLALLLATASTAFARPPPLDLPSRLVEDRRTSRSVFLIGPSTATRTQPHVKDLAPLEARAKTATGLARVEALDALTHALEDRDIADADLEVVLARVAKLYSELLVEPALEQSPHADELMIRAVRSMIEQDLAAQTCERLLAKYPSSRFALDAHMALAHVLEIREEYARAKPHLLAVISSGNSAFANHAGLKLGWLLNVALQQTTAVDQLVKMSASDNHIVADAALDLVVIPYARAGRADLAAALFDRIDRSTSATRLRNLAVEYADQGKHAEIVVVLRDAIARDRNPRQLCLDRADIVAALVAMGNRR